MNAPSLANKNFHLRAEIPAGFEFAPPDCVPAHARRCRSAYAGVTASISGTVTDTSGAAIVGATVTATNVDTGIASTQQTNGQGFYSFQSLPLGKYTVEVEQKGFKKPTARPDSSWM